MFDRSVGLGSVQVGFIDHLCLPLYEAMAKFSKELQPLVEGCLANRIKWVEIDTEDKRNTGDAKAGHARNL